MEADAPIFKRKKSRPTRIRDAQSPDAESQNSAPGTPAEAEDSPMTLATKLKAKQKARAKPQARLSFGVEEEDGGETFKVKKSALSLKMKAGNASPHVAHLPTAVPPVADTPSYTADYLNELRAANAAPRPRPPQDDDGNSMDVEAYNADELAAMGLDEVFAGVSFAYPKLYERYTAETELKHFPVLESASGATIPGGAAVLEAKKKRERLRAIGAPNTTAVPSDEFISLSLTKRSGDEDDGTPARESRLEREEDDLGDGEDELAEYTGAKERVALGKKAKKEEAKRRRAGMVEMIEDMEQDDDEETKEWEMTQIRRNEGPEKAKEPVKAVYKPAPIPAATTIPNLGSSIATLAASLNALTTSHTQNTTALNNLADERNALEAKEANLRHMVETAEGKRAWFKDMRDWVESIADFLDTKFPQLEKLEEEQVSLMSERYGMISKRRAEDDEDDACLFLNLPEKPQDSNEPEMDELGRVRPSMSQGRHAPVRKARRADRERRHAARKSSSEEGFSTDSSLGEADEEDFETAIGSLRQRVSGLLSDVQLKDFKDARLAVADKFSEWRKLYGDSYSGAWGGLGAVSAWEFWARLEMVGWDPLHEEVARSLDSFNWYSGLYEYSRPKGDSSGGMEVDDDDDEPPLGPDGDLVNSMVSTAVIPRLLALVSGGELDPYSTKNVRRLIDLVEQVEICVPRTDVKFLGLLQAATRVFRDAVTSTYDLVKPGLDSTSASPFDPAALHARIRFLSKRLKLLTVILRWRKFAGELFGIGETVHRLTKDIMLPIALGGWDVGGRDIMLKVVKALPADLVLPELTAQVASAS